MHNMETIINIDLLRGITHGWRGYRLWFHLVPTTQEGGLATHTTCWGPLLGLRTQWIVLWSVLFPVWSPSSKFYVWIHLGCCMNLYHVNFHSSWFFTLNMHSVQLLLMDTCFLYSLELWRMLLLWHVCTHAFDVCAQASLVSILWRRRCVIQHVLSVSQWLTAAWLLGVVPVCILSAGRSPGAPHPHCQWRCRNCVHVHVCVYTYACQVCVCTCMCTHTHAKCMCICVYTYTCTCVQF